MVLRLNETHNPHNNVSWRAKITDIGAVADENVHTSILGIASFGTIKAVSLHNRCILPGPINETCNYKYTMCVLQKK